MILICLVSDIASIFVHFVTIDRVDGCLEAVTRCRLAAHVSYQCSLFSHPYCCVAVVVLSQGKDPEH